MSTKIIDLDELLGPPKRVKLAGETYTLPPQIPAPLYLKMKAANEAREEGADDDAEQDRVEIVYGEVLELFQQYQPDLEELPVGIVQVFQVIPRIYMAPEESDAAPKATRKTTRARTGNASTRGRSKTKSR